MCLNHPELVQKHPTHIASSVLVRRFDEVGSICFAALKPATCQL